MKKLLIAVVLVVAAVAVVKYTHLFGGGGGSTTSGQVSPGGQLPTPDGSAPASVDPQTLYPGQVGLHFAADASASSRTVDCGSDINLDFVVSTDGQPVQWKAASSDNANGFIGHPIGGIDVAPGSGTLQGGETTQFHVSGSPNGIIGTFWVGVVDVRGSGATLEVDCAS